MDARTLRAHGKVAAAEAALYDALGALIVGCKERGMNRAATRSYAAALRAKAHPCVLAECGTCRADDAAFDMLWSEEVETDD